MRRVGLLQRLEISEVARSVDGLQCNSLLLFDVIWSPWPISGVNHDGRGYQF